MQIELYIDGKKKIFTTPYVPMLAKRKYLEIMARSEEGEGEPSFQEQIEEEDELASILTDIVFQKQFTLEQLYQGASDEYVYRKLREAIFGRSQAGEDEGNGGKGE